MKKNLPGMAVSNLKLFLGTKYTNLESTITGILLDNFEDVQKTLGNGSLALGMNASDIARNELHANVGVFDVTGIVNAIKDDAKNQGGEKDYKVDIGP